MIPKTGRFTTKFLVPERGKSVVPATALVCLFLGAATGSALAQSGGPKKDAANDARAKKDGKPDKPSGPLGYNPPAEGTVLVYNGVRYTFGKTDKRRTKVDVRFGKQRTRITLVLQDIFLTVRSRVRNRVVNIAVKSKKPLWPIRPGDTFTYSWVTRVDGDVHSRGTGTIRAFSRFGETKAAGRTYRTLLLVKEQSWQTLRGDKYRSRQNLAYAPEVGFYVKDERFFFRNDKPLPPVVLTLKRIEAPKK